jgi:hypothetical protein
VPQESIDPIRALPRWRQRILGGTSVRLGVVLRPNGGEDLAEHKMLPHVGELPEMLVRHDAQLQRRSA